MNHQNGQPKMTRLGNALSTATKALEGGNKTNAQQIPVIPHSYGDAILGVECALPHITGGDYVQA